MQKQTETEFSEQRISGIKIVPLPDVVDVPRVLPIGRKIWVLKTYNMLSSGLSIRPFVVVATKFCEDEGLVYTARSEALDLRFTASEVDLESGQIRFSYRGYHAYLERHLAEEALRQQIQRLQELITKATEQLGSDTTDPPLGIGANELSQPEVQSDPQGEPRMWLVVRTDLEIPRGKLAAQAGHGFLEALWLSRRQDTEAERTYMASASRTKITLAAKGEKELKRAYEDCQKKGIPAALIRDEGRTIFAEPTLTVVGIGPCRREDLPPYVRRLRLLEG